ncbi:ecdysone-induced protein 93F isoform X2 [Brevipalpus obovatus]|uniref:ecdysone-induced protein 93F isoform X2 n=1 Tax=Brevipalpus obovatus TaxID=246614 RepID=UPI003D9F1F6A
MEGLERVAQELMGGKRWNKLNTSFNYLEPSEPQDWSSEDACCFCSLDKHDTNQPEPIQHSEECISTNASGTVKCLCRASNIGTNGNDISGNNVSIGLLDSVGNNGSPTVGLIGSGEQPLDLSLHSRKQLATDSNDDHSMNNSTPLLRVPQPATAKSSKKTRPETSSTWKRTYTEKELQAALNDIQSGKLGTRRAAVIYGIPRSTLRNKVYKLCSDRKKGKPLAASASPVIGTIVSASNGSKQSPVIVNGTSSPSDLTSQTKLKGIENHSLMDVSGTKVVDSTARKCKNDEPKDNSDTNHISSNLIDNSNNPIAREALMQVLKKAINQRGSKSYGPMAPDSVHSNVNECDTDEQVETSEFNTSAPGFFNNNMVSNNANLLNDSLPTLQNYLSALDRGNPLGPLLYQILLNVHNFPWLTLPLADNTINSSELNKSISNTLPFLHELIPKLVQERLRVKNNNNIPTTNNNGSPNTSIPDANFCDSSSNNNVILRVPSYHPKSADTSGSSISSKNPALQNMSTASPTSLSFLSSALSLSAMNVRGKEGFLANESNVSTPFDGSNFLSNRSDSNLSSHSLGDRKDNTSDLINTIKDENHFGPSSDRSQFTRLSMGHSDESSSDALMNENKNSQRSRKSDKRNPPLSTASDLSAPSTPDPKRNRPKRGRYRNYKRDDLARAVRAVQMGEMSVHRAGTHFGVPHSTLEYKVKERHLLRPKKRQTSASSSSASSIIKKDESNRSLLIPSKNNSSESTAQSTGSLNQSSANNFSFWQSALFPSPDQTTSPLNNTNTFFASNMMRKLRENARLEFNSQRNSRIVHKGDQEINNNLPSNHLITSNKLCENNPSTGSRDAKDQEYNGFLLESLIKSALSKKNSVYSNDSGENSDNKAENKYNASLAALKEVTSIDVRKE